MRSCVNTQSCRSYLHALILKKMSEQNNDVKVCQLDFFLFQHFNKQVLQQCIFVKSHFFNAEIVQTVEHNTVASVSQNTVTFIRTILCYRQKS